MSLVKIIFIISCPEILMINAISMDPDQIPLSVAFDLSQHCYLDPNLVTLG